MSKISFILLGDSTGVELDRGLQYLNKLKQDATMTTCCVAAAVPVVQQKYGYLQSGIPIQYYQSWHELYTTSSLCQPLSKLVSILLPTRARPQNLLKALAQLLDKTQDKEAIELVLGIDLDDWETLAILNQLPPEIDTKILIRPRGKGYEELYQLLNQSMDIANGEFGFFFTDDAVMQTTHWDSYLKKYSGYFCSFSLHTGTSNVFPIIAKKLYNVLGHLALHPFADSWVEEILGFLKLEISLPDIHVLHDTTQNQGHFSLTYMASYYSYEMCYARYQDIQKILNHLHVMLNNRPLESQAEYRYLLDKYGFFYGLSATDEGVNWKGSRVSIHAIRMTLDQYDPDEKVLHLADVNATVFFRFLLNEILSFYLLVHDLVAATPEHKITCRTKLQQVKQNIQVLLGFLPNHVLTWYYLAMVNMALDHHDDALACCQQFVSLMEHGPFVVVPKLFEIMTPFGPPFLILQWEGLSFRYGQLSEQREAGLKLLTWQMYHIMGYLCQNRGQHEQAQHMYQKALAAWPDCLLTQMNLITAILAQRTHTPFVGQYLEMVWAEPYLADLCPNLGYELLQAGYLKEARQYLEQATPVSIEDKMRFYISCQTGTVPQPETPLIAQYLDLVKAKPDLAHSWPTLSDDLLYAGYVDEASAYIYIAPNVSAEEKHRFHQLCHIAKWIQTTQDTPNTRFDRALLGLRFDTHFYQGLKRLLSQPLYRHWEAGQRMISNVSVQWQTQVAERWPLPVNDVEMNLRFASPPLTASTTTLLIHPQAPAFPHCIQRVYHQKSDLSQGLLGPDTLPYCFPIDVNAQLEIEDLQGFHFLFVCSDWSSLEIVQVFMHAFQSTPHVSGLLWNPLAPPTEEELAYLSHQLSEDTDTPVTLLTEPLAPEEQATLLKKADVVIGNPGDWVAFYLWWALYLGVPVWFLEKPWLPYACFNDELLQPLVILDYRQGFQHYVQDIVMCREQACQIQQRLRTFYQEAAPQQILDALWQLKFHWIMDK